MPGRPSRNSSSRLSWLACAMSSGSTSALWQHMSSESSAAAGRASPSSPSLRCAIVFEAVWRRVRGRARCSVANWPTVRLPRRARHSAPSSSRCVLWLPGRVPLGAGGCGDVRVPEFVGGVAGGLPCPPCAERAGGARMEANPAARQTIGALASAWPRGGGGGRRRAGHSNAGLGALCWRSERSLAFCVCSCLLCRMKCDRR